MSCVELILAREEGWAVGRVRCCFFFNDTATTEIYTLSLHDALPICRAHGGRSARPPTPACARMASRDRKSTRLNSSHRTISYAVFCLKKKKNQDIPQKTENKKNTNRYIKEIY